MLEGFSVRQDPLYGRTTPRGAVGTSSGFDSPAALLGTRRVSARRGWVGEKSGHFEHPEVTMILQNLLHTRRRVDVRKAPLPTVAPIAQSIVTRAGEEWGVIIWRSVDPGASQVEAEAYRGIGIDGRGCLHNRVSLCQLALQVRTRGSLAVELSF